MANNFSPSLLGRKLILHDSGFSKAYRGKTAEIVAIRHSVVDKAIYYTLLVEDKHLSNEIPLSGYDIEFLEKKEHCVDFNIKRNNKSGRYEIFLYKATKVVGTLFASFDVKGKAEEYIKFIQS